MSATEAKIVRDALKKELGLNRNHVSVKGASFSMGSSVDVTIKTINASFKDVERIAESVKRVRYCEVTQEILGGGNMYVHVNVDDSVYVDALELSGCKDELVALFNEVATDCENNQGIGREINGNKYMLMKSTDMFSWSMNINEERYYIYVECNKLCKGTISCFGKAIYEAGIAHKPTPATPRTLGKALSKATAKAGKVKGITQTARPTCQHEEADGVHYVIFNFFPTSALRKEMKSYGYKWNRDRSQWGIDATNRDGIESVNDIIAGVILTALEGRTETPAQKGQSEIRENIERLENTMKGEHNAGYLENCRNSIKNYKSQLNATDSDQREAISTKAEDLAESMTQPIHDKFNPAVLGQNPTPRRAGIIRGMAHDGEKLLRVQKGLYILATMARNCKPPMDLSAIKKLCSKKQIGNVLCKYDTTHQPQLKAFFVKAVDDYTTPEDTARKKEQEDRELESSLIGRKIDGFFPTPAPLVEQMLDYADIQPTDTVLEPSAGKGDIVKAIHAACPLAIIDAMEINYTLADLMNRSLPEGSATVMHTDFLELEPSTLYDKIVMNPPFEKRADAIHILHAYKHLKKGGRLVAIAGAGAKFRHDAPYKALRDLIEYEGGEMNDNEEGAFKSAFRSTGVRTVMVIINKE